MSKEKPIQPDKKTLRKDITLQLEQALAALKEQLGEKKFNSRLKKAVKVLTEDMDPVKEEKAKKPKEASDKKSTVSANGKEQKKALKKEPGKTDKVLKRVTAPKKETAKADKPKPAARTKK